MPKSPKAAARKTRRADRRPNSGFQAQKPHLTVVPQQEEFSGPRVKPSSEPIVPQTEPQHRYMNAIKSQRVTFGIGSAGTGKTWLPATMAADALRNGEIDRIILTRPAVEAGEKLGFLPGDLKEKYEPYLAPFLDALEERLGTGHLEYLIRKELIVPRPLAFMRGLTFKNAWVLADEAQNISKNQMKMLLTRIGKGGKFIITGDPKQTDLPAGQSGLEDAVHRLSGIDGIKAIRFQPADVVRDDICHQIVLAYENE
jgi:phosphate starvation-inducible protein PhoH and related proteins